MKRGDLVTIAMQGDYGKPRPALIIQSDLFTNKSLTVLPVTSHLTDAPLIRVDLEANEKTGLDKQSQVMVDKILTINREKVGATFGKVKHQTILEIERCLAVFLGIA